ncbi:hypothetical protein D1BOALGB6SA_7190 [Olavius sp. associated proteobacterium Delta 1]|nr:hypothetical protein D1BOALGB6SA_7190 [Olavius sp. associated proteobacterium Delta 1]
MSCRDKAKGNLQQTDLQAAVRFSQSISAALSKTYLSISGFWYSRPKPLF